MTPFRHQGSRILIIRPGALGDTLLALPAIRALRRAAGPEARLEVVGYPAWLELALNPLHADAAHSIDRGLFAGLFGPALQHEIRRFLAGFSLVVAWCHDREGWLASTLRQAAVDCLQAAPYPSPTDPAHATDHLLRTLTAVGIEAPEPSTPELSLPDEARVAARGFLRERRMAPGEFLAVHPGSGSPSKDWSPERFARVAERARTAGLKPLLVCGEADRDSVGALLSRLAFEPPLAAELDVLKLAAVLEEAAAYVGNDSGVTHLAAATGVPTVALFGPSDPRIWAPRGPRVAVLAHETDPDSVWGVVQSSMVSPPTFPLSPGV